MNRSNASTGIGGPLLIAGLVGAGIIYSQYTGDVSPLNSRETFERDYGPCLESTGYDLEDLEWDHTGKELLGSHPVGSLLLKGSQVIITPGEEDQGKDRLIFTFNTPEGEPRSLTPDPATQAILTKYGC
jgi:hypothetical protein